LNMAVPVGELGRDTKLHAPQAAFFRPKGAPEAGDPCYI
jgi:hypothetical protein